MARLVAQLFDKSELVVIQGGQTTGAAFTSLPFDHLIYTGSTPVGIAIMRAASENLTPLTLELGGKSPVLIGRSADLADAVRRVMTAKIFNAGQGCLLECSLDTRIYSSRQRFCSWQSLYVETI
jgi:coniferyl-aldehyde dehydrogenase